MISILSRRVLPLCAALLAGVAATTVVPRDVMAAKQAKVPVAIGSFTGPQSKKIRAKVMEVLRKSGSYELTDAEDIKPGAKTASYASMAKAMGANAIIVGVVSKRYNLTLTIYGGNGARVDALEVKGGGGPFGLTKKIENELEITIADPIAKAKPPGGASKAEPAAAKGKTDAAVEEEEPELGEEGETEPPIDGEEGDSGGESEGDSEGGDSSDVEEPSEPSEPGLRPLELIAGVRGYNRSFEYTSIRPYTDESLTPLHPYSLPLAPSIVASVNFYPAALFRNDAWSHLGLSGGYELGIATTTQYSSGGIRKDLSTASAAWRAGLRGRLPLGTHELGIFAEYGAHTFILKGDEVYAPPPAPYATVPDTKYTFIRTGIDATFRFGKVVAGAHVAPRFLQSLSDLDLRGVWFPGATGSGLDAGIMGGYDALSFMSVVGGVDALRYGFDFNNMRECYGQRRCVVAGGATDTYLSGWLGVMFRMDGSAAEAAE